MKQTTKNNNFNNLPDDENPAYTFQVIKTSILLKAAKGEIDLRDLATRELAERGLSIETGLWIGFKEAARLLRKREEKKEEIKKIEEGPGFYYISK